MVVEPEAGQATVDSTIRPQQTPSRGPVEQVTTPNGVSTQTYVLTYEPADEVMRAEEWMARGPLTVGGAGGPSTVLAAPVTTPATTTATPPVATAAEPVVPAGWKKYTVKAGDTLYGIARLSYGPAHGSQYTRILDVNKSTIANANSLKIGMVLMIPPLEATTVSPAQTSPTPAKPAPQAVPAVRPADGIAKTSTPGTATGVQPIELKAQASPPKPVRTYVVQKGDTLFNIARRNDMKVDELARLNGIKDANMVRVGQKLVLAG
jgi:LysM repeat protein